MITKRHILSILLSLSLPVIAYPIPVIASEAKQSRAQSDAPYFCTEEGERLEYVRKRTNGKVKWFHFMDIVREGENGVIIYTSQLFNEAMKPRFSPPAEMTALVSDKGVEIDVAASMGAIFKSILGNSVNILTFGDRTFLPSDMSPGDTLPSAYCSVKALGMTMNISVTERKVLFLDTLTTPAGTFECIVVQEHKVEKGMGRNRVTTARTWYSRGVGMVRHDTCDKNGDLESVEILCKKIKKFVTKF